MDTGKSYAVETGKNRRQQGKRRSQDKQLIDWRAIDSNYGGRIEVYPDGSYLDKDEK